MIPFSISVIQWPNATRRCPLVFLQRSPKTFDNRKNHDRPHMTLGDATVD
jgi:hypothetical protein